MLSTLFSHDMPRIVLWVTLLSVITSFNLQAQSQITAEDLRLITGDWTGTITYLDYRTNEPFSMPANLEVMPTENNYVLVLNYTYPEEPKANNLSKIKVTKNGASINKHPVTSRTQLENGDIEVQTEHNGKDDNRKALIRNTYTLGKDRLVMKKEVRFESGSWIKRNEFAYQRVK